MTPGTIGLVQESHGWVVPIAEPAAELFYKRLFETAPEVKPLFKGDMKEQGRKLMATIAVVVNALDRLESVLPALKALAIRHVDYGVRDEHYDKVGAALLWTLQAGLGNRFTEAHRTAWLEAYTALSGVMRTEVAAAKAAKAGAA